MKKLIIAILVVGVTGCVFDTTPESPCTERDKLSDRIGTPPCGYNEQKDGFVKHHFHNLEYVATVSISDYSTIYRFQFADCLFTVRHQNFIEYHQREEWYYYYTMRDGTDQLLVSHAGVAAHMVSPTAYELIRLHCYMARDREMLR